MLTKNDRYDFNKSWHPIDPFNGLRSREKIFFLHKNDAANGGIVIFVPVDE